MHSKSTIKTPEQRWRVRSTVFIVSSIFSVFIFFTPFSCVSIVDFRQVNVR